jgi:hypothetical protein
MTPPEHEAHRRNSPILRVQIGQRGMGSRNMPSRLSPPPHWRGTTPSTGSRACQRFPTAEQLRLVVECSQPDVRGGARVYPLTQSGQNILVRLVLIIKGF